MKLLMTTQALDLDDPVLSAYHGWVVALAKKVEHLHVIVLKDGRHELPENVTVHSLGKENGKKPFWVYALRFYTLAWKLRKEYEAVFVHMNQEYILIAGDMWLALGKRIYLWRNHYAGSLLTDIAAAFCKKVFCTSKHSYTAKYKKTVFMPVGIDAEKFSPGAPMARVSHSILFFSRISPSKRPELFIDALALLEKKGVAFTASIVGSSLPKYQEYYAGLQKKVEDLGLSSKVVFTPGVPNGAAPDVFRAHELYVNVSPSGMLDKTMFEAAGTGCLVVALSKDFAEMAGKDYLPAAETAAALAEKLQEFLALPDAERAARQKKMEGLAASQSLDKLMDMLARNLS